MFLKSRRFSQTLGNSQLVELTEEEIAELDGIFPEVSFRACDGLWTGWGHLGMKDVEARLAAQGE